MTTPTTTPTGAKTPNEIEPTSLQNEGDSIDLSPQALLVQRVTKRENVRQKGARLLVSGRLRVVKVDGNLIVAECRGDSGEVYKLGFDPRKKQFRCTCAAMGPCSHLHALWAVTAVER